MLTARTDKVDEEIDGLCEHPLLVRIMELSIVGLHFGEKSEVEPYPDAFYLLSVEARMTLFQRRLRSIQRLLRDLTKDLDIAKVPFSLHGLIEVFADAAYMRVSSVSDLLLIVAREVLEISLVDKDTTFGNISRATTAKAILPHLGRISDPERAFRAFRNSRIHSGFERGFDDYDAGFEMASMFRDRGHGLQVMSQTDDSVVSLQSLYELRRTELLSEFLDEFIDLIPNIDGLLTILEEEFNDRFATKTALPNSYMAIQKMI